MHVLPSTQSAWQSTLSTIDSADTIVIIMRQVPSFYTLRGRHHRLPPHMIPAAATKSAIAMRHPYVLQSASSRYLITARYIGCAVINRKLIPFGRRPFSNIMGPQNIPEIAIREYIVLLLLAEIHTMSPASMTTAHSTLIR